MKCKNCGAEISSEEKKCPFCECEVVADTPEQTSSTTINNYYGSAPKNEETNSVCPKCGGNRIKFKREEIGSKKGKKSRDVLYRTVGICQDCGHTWDTTASDGKRSHSAWWWILVVLFFPISLSIWFYKTDKIKLDKKYRIIILVVVWIILLILGKVSPSDSTTNTNEITNTLSSITITESVDTAQAEEPEEAPKNDAAPETTAKATTTTTKAPTKATTTTTTKATTKATTTTTTKATTKATTTTTTKPAIPLGKINALKKAQDYLAFSSFSHKGLVEQLEFEGFTNEEANYGADNCGADWNEQAAKKAQNYLDFSSFSRDGLIEQLEFEGFTHEQALYGVTAVGY